MGIPARSIARPRYRRSNTGSPKQRVPPDSVFSVRHSATDTARIDAKEQFIDNLRRPFSCGKYGHLGFRPHGVSTPTGRQDEPNRLMGSLRPCSQVRSRLRGRMAGCFDPEVRQSEGADVLGFGPVALVSRLPRPSWGL